MTNKLNQWPNKLGFDIGETEIWQYSDAFGVYGPSKLLRVPYSVTTDPIKAFSLCQIFGVNRTQFEDLEYEAQNQLYHDSYKRIPVIV